MTLKACPDVPAEDRTLDAITDFAIIAQLLPAPQACANDSRPVLLTATRPAAEKRPHAVPEPAIHPD
jgi:hypothetical protein